MESSIRSALTSGPTARAAEGYEYGHLLLGTREAFEIEVSRWSGSSDEKTFLREHVFVYEQGRSPIDARFNEQRRLNELGERGWELIDADKGILRRVR